MKKVLSIDKIKKKPKNKWSLAQFIFWGFNFTVGYAFIVGLNKSFSPVGVFLPVVIFIGALIAFVVGFSFARMSTRFASNGGIYLYSKKTFGKTFAYYAGFWQYIQAPIVALSAFLGMLWAFYGINISGHNGHNNGGASSTYVWWVGALAAFLFITSYIIMSFGFVSTKWSLYVLWFLKWIVILFSMILALIYAKHFYDNIFKSPANPFLNSNSFKLTTSGLIQSVITFFFAFGGFEGIAVVSEDVENPKRNMAISLVTIIILAFLFYLLYYLLILGSVGSRIGSGGTPALSSHNYGNASHNQLDSNPINILLQKAINGNKELDFGASAGLSILMAIVIISQLSNKSTSRLMNGWVNARILAVIAADGFLPVRLAAKNKYGQFKSALLLDLWITMILIIIFYPVYLATQYNIADAIDLYTISAFIQYLFILVIVIYTKFKEKKESSIRLLEVIAYIIMIPVIVAIVIAYFYFGLSQGIDSIKNHSFNFDNIGGFATTGTTLLIIILSIILYYVGKSLGWHKESLNENSDFSHHLDLSDIESQPNL